MSMLFNFKDFLTLDEVGEYLAANGYPKFDRDRVITFVKDLINEGKLSVAVYYKGDVGNELLYRDSDRVRVDSPEDSCYINTYSWLDFNTSYALFNSESPIDNGISSKDIIQGRFNLTPNIKDYKSLLDHKNEAYHCWTFIENKDYTITLNNVRYYRPDLDKLLNNQALTDAQDKIAELEQQLSKFQAAAPDVVNIPFRTRLDSINKDLPQDERVKKSYQIYSNDFSFYEDKHPVNTPDEMIKRIQGLLNVIKKKDNKIFELEQQTNTPANAQAEIDKLKEQLDKANTELAAAKTTTTDQPLDWQNMSEHVYPPELHLALMIWQRIYVDNELKDSHITSHGGKFKVIAKRLGLNPDNTLGKRVAMLINTAHSKNKQDELADPLRAIEQLYMPPKKEKTTS